MKRDLNSLQNNEFDLLIVGGGIQGACVALEAAKSGLKTALVDRSDFGGATSANSLKILHGGLRYLQHMDLPRMIESIQSRRFFADLAPELVQVLPCVMPTEKWGIKHALPMWVALKLNDMIAFNRNKGLVERVKLPPGNLLSTRNCQDLFPLVSEPFAHGGARWYDYLILNSERLTLECLHRASALGADVANYVEVEDYLIEEGVVKGVKARSDLGDGSTFEIRAKTTLNTVGPWWNKSLQGIEKNGQAPLQFAKAVNLVLHKQLLKDHAVGLESKDPENGNKKRFFFVVPWQDGTMIGTTYTPIEGADPNDLAVGDDEVRAILDAVRSWFPKAELNAKDVAFVHAGYLPIDRKKTGAGYRLHGDVSIVDHETKDQLKGLFSIKTVKYTTGPVVAREFIRRLNKKVGRKSSASESTSGEHELINDKDLDASWKQKMQQKYGSRAKGILSMASKDNNLTQLIDPEHPLTLAEVLYYIREEMALHLEDVVLRRGGVGATIPSVRYLTKVATIVAEELEWDEERISNEILAVRKLYKSRGMLLSEA